MKDEEYVLRQENREKAITARSARSRRTHCGKGGRVKLPSDYMTKKELNKMNGEVEVYRLNSPMKWAEFKAMPDEHKVTYIKLLRNKWGVPDSHIAKMMGISGMSVSQENERLGIRIGRSKTKTFDKEGWLKWAYGVPTEQSELPVIEEVTVEAPVEEAVDVVEEVKETAAIEEQTVVRHAIPDSGSMTFEGKTEDILRTLGVLLSGAKVHIGITWDLLEVDDG